MSSLRDADWLRRLWSLGRPGSPAVEYVQHVNVVNDRGYSSSHEHAPVAQQTSFLAAGGAGVHVFFELTGSDGLAPPLKMLHRIRAITSTSATVNGFLSWVIANPASVTTATRVATTPQLADSDPDVAALLFEGTIATANLPATRRFIPMTRTIGQTGATPAFPFGVTEVDPISSLHYALRWNGPESLFVFVEDANTALFYHATWQAMRA